MAPLLILVTFSYLVASIPFGYLLVRIFRGEDVRQSGSGNTGATNVARSEPLLGLVTLLLDAGKGSLAVFAAILVSRVWDLGHSLPEADTAIRSALAALLAILGHMFPVWLKFKGGKGVATGLGSFALLAPKSTLIAVGVFVLAMLLFRYVSLASMMAVSSFPLPVWLLREYHEEPVALALISASAVMIVLKHHRNISRLLQGTEPQFQLRRG
jgi:glycerol-3-phosphate acyltransferase PlsY